MDDNLTVARAFLDRFAASASVDPEACTPDATWWTFLYGTVPVSEHVRRSQATANALFAGPGHFAIEDTVTDSESVVISARGQQPLHDGRTYENIYLWMFGFKDGRIATIRTYFDTELALRTFNAASA